MRLNATIGSSSTIAHELNKKSIPEAKSISTQKQSPSRDARSSTAASKDSNLKTYTNLMKSQIAKRTMPYERLKKLEQQIQEWNTQFGTSYTLL